MADRVASVSLFFDDFESGIQELDSHERGVYISLILRYYATAGRLKDDDRTLARNCNCSLQAYRKTKTRLAELGKIAVVDGYIYQPRAEHELKASWVRLEKWKTWQRQKDRKKIEKSSGFRPENPNKIRTGRKQPKPEGFGLPPTGKSPNPKSVLKTDMSALPETPASPMRGAGVPSSDEALRPLLVWLQGKVQGLMTAHVLSARDVRLLKEAVRGGSEECLLMASDFTPDDQMTSALKRAGIEWHALPKLKSISGGKSA